MAAPEAFQSTSLYVGDLDPGVTEAQLYEFFNQMGPVVSIRVCRDLVTRRSLGYAYVNYTNSADAARALETLNFTPIAGRMIRIMYSHRDPSLRKSGTGNIFVKNLDKSIDNKALHDTFAPFGTILSCKVATEGASGASKGYGFVQFASEDAAREAISKVNNMLLNDKQVYVGPFLRREDRHHGGRNDKFLNLYVKNLSESVTEDQLREVFATKGPVASVAIMKDAEGKSRGFGFVNYENAESAASAVSELDGHQHDGKAWYVGRAQKKSERDAELRVKYDQAARERQDKYAGANLYIKNLDDSINDERIRELFSEFGTITSCKILRDNSGVPRGSGFVAFSSAEEATRAVTEMNGKLVGSKPLYVALAQRREERQARLQAQFSQQRFGGMGMDAGPAGMSMYPPPALGQQIFFGAPGGPPMLPPQAYAAYQQQQIMAAGLRPVAGVPGYMGVPMMAAQRVPAAAQRMPRGRGGGVGGQQHARGGGRGGGQGQQGQGQPANTAAAGFRYTPPARGQGDGPAAAGRGAGKQGGGAAPAAAAAAPPAAVTESNGPAAGGEEAGGLTASRLAKSSPEERRAMLGEALYPLVEAITPDLAAKVTGMLLEVDTAEVLNLIHAPDSLAANVAEALRVLNAAGGEGGDAAPAE
eukprot:jgi/Mesvir1/27770/Mv07454-RA.1